MTAFLTTEKITYSGDQTEWLTIDGYMVLVQREEHLQSVWWRVYVCVERFKKLKDYYLGDVSTIPHETFENERFYTKSEYHHALNIHTSVAAAVVRLVHEYDKAEVK